MRVAVAVRVDRLLEPGEDLIRPGIDRERAVAISLPTRHADRKHRRSARHACETGRTALPHQNPSGLRPVELEPRRIAGTALRASVAAVTQDVQPVEHVPV